MRKQPRWKYFIEMTNFWMGKLGFSNPIEIRRDNRLDCPCAVITAEDWTKEAKITMAYNSRRLSREPIGVTLSNIFHEIGHLLERLPYDAKEEQIASEYAAERFSVTMMKKHYPELFKEVIEHITKKRILYKYYKVARVYYEAYVRIPEYEKTMTKKDKEKIKKLQEA